jgi:glycosyltransferase involved in cell wall biosynthesis
MKIIHVPFCFYPGAVGGTEVYVTLLARLLKEGHGCDVLIAAPGGRSEQYTHENLRVRRFEVSPEVADISELYGEGDEVGAREFAKILDEERPDIVHLHAFTRGVSLRIVRAAKVRKVPVVFTYHTPTVTCTLGTMMRWGRIPCDGEMLGRRCTACTLHGLGLNRLVATGVASMPRRVRKILGKTKKSGGIWTALRMRELVERRHNATRALLAEVDHIVAVCEWVRDVLVRNGVPANKITLCRQGVPDNREPITDNSRRRDSAFQSFSVSAFSQERPLRLVYFGRLDPTKGVHVLIEALQLDKALPVTLDVYGTAQGEGGAAYADRLQKLVMHDGRIAFKASVPSEKVIPTMRTYDAVVVPSQWLETGPLVVLEAFAARIPVLGSDLGGIAELVVNGVNGLLVSPSEINAWCNAVLRLCRDAGLYERLCSSLPTPPVMESVARTMIDLYRNLPEPLHAPA